MSPTAYNLIALVFVCGFVVGIRLMNSPRTAVRGNLLGAGCMLGAILLTLVSRGLLGRRVLWLSMAAGALIGCVLALRVAMTQMPQLVAILNGLGGGASAVVALIVLNSGHAQTKVAAMPTGALALIVGAVTLSGSVIAAAKLAGKVSQTPVILRGHAALNAVAVAAMAASVLLAPLVPAGSGVAAVSLAALLAAAGFGLLFAIRVGGADMPITISLLNSLSGVAASITGLAISNPLLVAAGAIVGSAGVILTQAMCRAMNRTLYDVLGGRTVAQPAGPAAADRPPAPTATPTQAAPAEGRVSDILAGANTVVIVPGYGMALAEAQHQVRALFDRLEGQGKQVRFAIHPVAGRMPGHMDVLLAEAGVPYEKLCEMEAINPELKYTDVALVVGANDVINPAARTAEGTPIYGMPILNVEQSKHVIICNKDTQPGYAGVANPLYGKGGNVVLLLGDARQTLNQLLEEMA